MFASVGRRLALLNAIVVIAVIAVVGLAIALVLRFELDREESRTLHSRAEYAAVAWQNEISSGTSDLPVSRIGASDGDEEGEDFSDHEDREAIESGDVVLFGVDLSGAIVINDRGVTLTGLPNQDGLAAAFAGETDERVVHIDGKEMRLVSVPVRDAGGSVIGAVQAARGQTEFQSQLRIAVYTSLAGVIIGAIIAPITGLFLARRAMRPIDAAFATQRAFVADASHEMRTPLAVLRANAEMLIRVPDMSEADVRLEATNIISEVDEIARLVDDLIFLAQADEGAPGLFDHTPIDVRDLLEAEVTAHQHRVTAAGMSMTVSAEPGVLVVGDAARLRQVVRILIDNAILYGRPDGTISVSSNVDGDTAVVRVADTGLGIARDDLRRIFDRFYRASDARGHRSGGSGLGLAIAKSIVEAHGGTIAVESEPGVGTTFTVRIPRAPGSPPVAA
ncbi:hypothetical protein BH09CHL1_BH09CHL1_17980 [soil metagenome]